MAHERVYHPETNEPFDVPAPKAADLRLNHGWTSTPWTRTEVVVQPDEEAPRGRGRRRRAVEDEEPILHEAGPAPFAFDEEADAPGEDWRS
jgi:hypothetical protein